MYLAYLDESGDDGFPEYSSKLFVLTALYFVHHTWRELFEANRVFRKELNSRYGLPPSLEMHTRPFLMGKKPYTNLGFTPASRVELIDRYCAFISDLEVRVVNVAIIKPRIRFETYRVLDKAISYLVTRLANDLGSAGDKTFMMLTDEGRVRALRRTTRRVQRYNPVPSLFNESPLRKEIRHLIEDPLPKDSAQSYFIQLADVVSCIVSMYGAETLPLIKAHNRLRRLRGLRKAVEWMEMLEPSLNTSACRHDRFGVAFYPRE